MPECIEAETLQKTKTLICKTQNASLKTQIIFENWPKGLLQVLANGLRYLRWGGDGEAVQLEKWWGVENCLRFAQNPQRQVHALLARFWFWRHRFFTVNLFHHELLVVYGHIQIH